MSRPLRIAGLGQHPDVALDDPIPGRQIQFFGQPGDSRPLTLQLDEISQRRLIQGHGHLVQAQIRAQLGVAEDRPQPQPLQDPAGFP